MHKGLDVCSADDYSLHPTLEHWLCAGYPVVICTDDTSLFGITLSDELARVAVAFGLSYRETAQLAISGALAIFDANSEVAAALVERCEGDANALLSTLDDGSQHSSLQRLEVRAGHTLRLVKAGESTQPRL